MGEKSFNWIEEIHENCTLYWHRVEFWGYPGSFNSYLGTGRELAFRTNNEVWARLWNTRFMCPECGFVWGAVVYEPNRYLTIGPVHWRCELSPCEKHGKLNYLSDVDYDTIDENLLERIPWKILVISAVGSSSPPTKKSV